MQTSLSTKNRLINVYQGMERLGHLNDNGRLQLTELLEGE